jgi:hypothetical protein
MTEATQGGPSKGYPTDKTSREDRGTGGDKQKPARKTPESKGWGSGGDGSRRGEAGKS